MVYTEIIVPKKVEVRKIQFSKIVIFFVHPENSDNNVLFYPFLGDLPLVI